MGAGSSIGWSSVPFGAQVPKPAQKSRSQRSNCAEFGGWPAVRRNQRRKAAYSGQAAPSSRRGRRSVETSAEKPLTAVGLR